MQQSAVQETSQTVSKQDSAIALESPAQELLLFRLTCARTANGLSHYYMYGDVAPEETLL
ncbi:MAG: hypothetical protein Q8R28_09590 [Dehalococcoidia bacterium]|nr:hypothetical protein [Dehalococcoidia bacterium]